MLTSALVLAMVLGQAEVKPAAPEPVRAAVESPRDVSAMLAPIVAKHKVPGMAVAVVLDGRIVASGASGVRAMGSPETVTTRDLWHLGSCTKAMTATLAGVMVEKGEIAWETTLGEVFPEIEMKEAWKKVTLRQLTTNRSGAPTGLEKDGLWGRLWRFKGTATEARLELLKGVVKWEPDAAPGTKFIYSNAGFAMAGAMLERNAGKSWETLLTERVLAPLGLTSVGFGAPGTAEKVDQPRGHRGGKAVPPGKDADNPVAIGPAGTAHMTIEDWAKFAMAHAEGDRATKPILGAKTWALLHEAYPASGTADKDEYAGGWGVTTRPWAKGKGAGDTGRVLTHSGSNTMWHCVAWVAPERRFAVVVTCNQGDGQAGQATDAAAGAMIGEFLKAGR